MATLNVGESVPFLNTNVTNEVTWSGDGLGLNPADSVWRARLAHLHELGLVSKQAIEAVESTDLDADAAAAALERILGASNLLPASFLERGAECCRAVCLVKASGTNYRGELGSWSGTGFLIGPDVLLTNHHVLNSQAVAEEAVCIFDYELDPSGQMRSTTTYRLRPSRLFLTSPLADGLDFTLVWVEGKPGEKFGHIGPERSVLTIALDEFANVISHPGGDPKAVTIQDNQVKWQNELLVHYTSDTLPGSSGAAVFNNEWKAIALHHASKPSLVPKFAFLNEGIKMSAIATQLERWSQTGSQVEKAREALALFRGSDEILGFFGALGRSGTNATPEVEVVVDSYRGEYDDVDVAFWNIEWFSYRYPEKVDAVAEAIFRMNLDIWALEESSPAAAEALVERLNNHYGLDFAFIAAEPAASERRQTCTVLWNRRTVDVRQEPWGEPIETWLRANSRDFDDLALEAIEGKIFDRYPALLWFQSRRRRGQVPFNSYLVPVHLKAMAEGSKRRRMASEILAAAVHKKIEAGADADWIIGGDFNAELASDDFRKLADGKFTPLTAADADQGAFTYLKRPYRSLIDHIFVSKNLATTYGPDDVFIVAAEREIPDFVASVSDHRPVLFRISLRMEAPEALHSPATESESSDEVEAISELKRVLGRKPVAPSAADNRVPMADALEGGEVTTPDVTPSRAKRRKRNSYFKIPVSELAIDTYAIAATEGAETTTVTARQPVEPLHPMMLRLAQPNWTPPPGFQLQAQIDTIVSGICTDAALDALESDDNVRDIEASRPAGLMECATSMPFVKATKIQEPPVEEKGDRCLMAFIDSGIDILHAAFVDAGGQSRIVEIWDQAESGGTAPDQIHPQLRLNYGRVYTAAEIAAFRANPATVPPRLRDPQGHGTHVASIAAGSRDPVPGGFSGGLAQAAKIVLVIAKMDVNPGDPVSIGYSNSHFQALEYIDAVSQGLSLPVVINVSLGMNAGPHDGKSVLETGFEKFMQSGTKPGCVVVKSAGNERDLNGHAKLTLRARQSELLRWQSHAINRTEDLIEIWFASTMELRFRVQDPSGGQSSECHVASGDISWTTYARNLVLIDYDLSNSLAGDSLVRVRVRRGAAPSIQTGEWSLEITAGRVVSEGTINAWFERLNDRPTEFLNHQSNEITLSVPGTAESVITVAAVNSALPLVVHPRSSYGLTRDHRKKPELCAPGTELLAARSQTTNGVVAMSGTSMAAPHVSGAVALALSDRAKQPGKRWLTANQVRAALTQTTQNFDGFHSEAMGYGLLDVEAFFNRCRAMR